MLKNTITHAEVGSSGKQVSPSGPVSTEKNKVTVVSNMEAETNATWPSFRSAVCSASRSMWGPTHLKIVSQVRSSM